MDIPFFYPKCYVFLRHLFDSTFNHTYVYGSGLYYLLSSGSSVFGYLICNRRRELSAGFGL
jgi:hypothetical protein